LSLCLNKQAPRYEDVWASEGIAPTFSTSALDGGDWSASRPRRFSPQEKSPRLPLDRLLCGPQSQSGRCGEDKNLLHGWESNTGRPARSSSLYRLSYRSHMTAVSHSVTSHKKCLNDLSASVKQDLQCLIAAFVVLLSAFGFSAYRSSGQA
jgi:hypothetical protein